MSMEVIEFRREKINDSSFVGVLKDPVFYVLISEFGRVREVAIQLRGEFPYQTPIDTSFYDEEAYRNYIILKEYLLSEKGQEFLYRLDVDEDKFILGLYKALVRHHSFYGWFKQRLLIILEYLKHYSGKLGTI